MIILEYLFRKFKTIKMTKYQCVFGTQETCKHKWKEIFSKDIYQSFFFLFERKSCNLLQQTSIRSCYLLYKRHVPEKETFIMSKTTLDWFIQLWGKKPRNRKPDLFLKCLKYEATVRGFFFQDYGLTDKH